MDSFGEYLKRERELRGVILEEISKAGNISMEYLKALEDDDFDSLPEEVFVKGFLKYYAESIGMDLNEVILAYDSFMAKFRAERGGIETTPTDSNGNYLKAISFVILILILIVSAFFGFYYYENMKKSQPVFASKNEGATKTAKDETNIGKKTADSLPVSQPEPVEEPAQETKPETSPAPDKALAAKTKPSPPPEKETPAAKIEKLLTLTMKADGDAWISIVIDDTEIKEALLFTGEIARWKAREKFLVTLGHRGVTHLKLNGKDIDLPKGQGNILKDYLITLKR